MRIRDSLTMSMFVFVLSLSLLLMSCSDKNTEKKLTPDRDIAETLAGAIAFNTGGAIDQISDLCEFISTDFTKIGEIAIDKTPEKWPTIIKTYDSLTGFWNIKYERIRGTMGVVPCAHIKRVYQLKFLNANDEFQQYYVTNGDTARTVHFNIKKGEGNFSTRRINQQLDSLEAAWTVTKANEPIVRINGGYYRAAVDSIIGFNRERISDHSITMNFNNIYAPRGTHTNLYSAVSGNITGHIHANITFIGSAAYNDTSIDRDISIMLGSSNGRGSIILGNVHFWADLYTGELLD